MNPTCLHTQHSLWLSFPLCGQFWSSPTEDSLQKLSFLVSLKPNPKHFCNRGCVPAVWKSSGKSLTCSDILKGGRQMRQWRRKIVLGLSPEPISYKNSNSLPSMAGPPWLRALQPMLMAIATEPHAWTQVSRDLESRWHSNTWTEPGIWIQRQDPGPGPRAQVVYAKSKRGEGEQMQSGAHFPGPVRRWGGEIWGDFKAQGGADREQPWKAEASPFLWLQGMFTELLLLLRSL